MGDVLEVTLALARSGFTLEVEARFEPGVTIVFGPSGAGKSSLLGVVAGLVRPERGSVRLGEATYLDTAARRDLPVHLRGVGYVFQSLALFPHMTAMDNVLYGMSRDAPLEARRSEARAALERVGVAHVADRRPATFSGGEAQRVALARVFARRPRVLLLDEPFSALDRELRRDLAAEVRRYVDEAKIPTLFVTHHRREARSLGESVLALERGRVVGRGPVGDYVTGED